MKDGGRAQVVLVDDHPIVRDGLRQMIERDEKLHICAEASSAEEALQQVAASQPDLVTIDVFLDGINGIELTKILADKYPGIRILVLSMHDENLYAERALRAGAMGYVMKQAPSRTILDAMHKVLAGERYVSENLRDMLEEVKALGEATEAPADVASKLSRREMSIFRALGEGLDRSEIAARLHISIKTVETHRANIKNKLNIARSADLSQVARGWLSKTEGKGHDASVSFGL